MANFIVRWTLKNLNRDMRCHEILWRGYPFPGAAPFVLQKRVVFVDVPRLSRKPYQQPTHRRCLTHRPFAREGLPELPTSLFYGLKTRYMRIILVLHSSKAIGKKTATMTRRPGRASPDPWFGPQVELSSRDTGGLLDFLGIGKALPSQRIAAEEAPPALLQIEPTGSSGDEDLMEAWMRFQPGAGLETVVTTEIIGDDEDVAGRIIRFDIGQRSNVALGIARGRTAGQHLAIAHP